MATFVEVKTDDDGRIDLSITAEVGHIAVADAGLKLLYDGLTARLADEFSKINSERKLRGIDITCTLMVESRAILREINDREVL